MLRKMLASPAMQRAIAERAAAAVADVHAMRFRRRGGPIERRARADRLGALLGDREDARTQEEYDAAVVALEDHFKARFEEVYGPPRIMHPESPERRRQRLRRWGFRP